MHKGEQQNNNNKGQGKLLLAVSASYHVQSGKDRNRYRGRSQMRPYVCERGGGVQQWFAKQGLLCGGPPPPPRTLAIKRGETGGKKERKRNNNDNSNHDLNLKKKTKSSTHRGTSWLCSHTSTHRKRSGVQPRKGKNKRKEQLKHITSSHVTKWT
jgi:hypothetical protein